GDGNSDMSDMLGQQVSPVSGRIEPALHRLASKLPGLKATGVEIGGQVLGHRAGLVACGGGAIGWVPPIRGMGELCGGRQKPRVPLGRFRRVGIRLDYVEIVLLPDGVRHLDDPSFVFWNVRRRYGRISRSEGNPSV